MAYPAVKQIQRHHAGNLLFVFRHFPLSQAHPYAQKAAELSEASATEGRFWAMHDWLYENQDEWVAYGDAGLEAGVRAVRHKLHRRRARRPCWSRIALTALSTWLVLNERHEHLHVHQPLEHEHEHVHDGHHRHEHSGNEGPEPHTHRHEHEPLTHSHAHLPDLHHRHRH